MNKKLLVVAVLACSLNARSEMAAKRAPEPPVAIPGSALTVQLAAVTLGDDCGATAEPSKSKMKREAKADRACEQSSMQLALVAGNGEAPMDFRVKKVELYDDAGQLIGELTARSPTVWSEAGTYQAWDQRVAPAKKLSVSYALSAPNWSSVKGRWNKTYVLKAIVAVGAGVQTVKKEVHLEAETIMPANVKT